MRCSTLVGTAAAAAASAALAFLAACDGPDPSAKAKPGTGGGSSAAQVVRITGSDTMVNLTQAWAEEYGKVNPAVSVQVAGGGSGVGIANLIDGIIDIAASSRTLKEKEVARIEQNHGGTEPKESIVALDALCVYVHTGNPLNEIAIEDLAEIYGEGGAIEKWSQLGLTHGACDTGEIVRVSRQNNSGTYYYFREAVVGEGRELKLGSIDQNGSKDVVALVSKTPCAIGYSGMGYATPQVKVLRVARTKGQPAIAPTPQTTTDGTYPIARPLFLYTIGEPTGATKAFIDWTHSPQGQRVVSEVGYVPVEPTQ